MVTLTTVNQKSLSKATFQAVLTNNKPELFPKLSHYFSLLVCSGDDKINLAGGTSKFVTDVAVNDRGRCTWSGPATFKVNCEMPVDKWPFDEQVCSLAFGSYTYGNNLLRIKLFRDKSKFTSKKLHATTESNA